jgi:acetyl-CoA acetyltransferase
MGVRPRNELRDGVHPQGISADLIATLEEFSRDAIDEFALGSQKKACRRPRQRSLQAIGRAGAGFARRHDSRPR